MKNKCVGLDCEMCGNTKCPNEEKEKIINGIDVSGPVSSATNNNIYYSQKAVDELLNAIKRLQEENEELKAENEQLKKPCLIMPKVNQLAVPIEKYEKLYKALEKIRKEANRLLYEENPIYGYNNSNHFEMLAKYVLAKTKEVLEDSENVENN